MAVDDNGDLQRSLGRLEESDRHMEKRMDRLEELVRQGFEKMEASIQSVHEDIAELKSRDHERRGAWKIIAGVSSVVSVIVGLLVEWFANRGWH